MEWPELTIGICTYKRPWYAGLAMSRIHGMIGYSGKIRWHIADGGSPQDQIDYYKVLLRDRPVSVEVKPNLADMVNSCAHNGGDFFMVIMDDYALRYPVDVTVDVHLLMEHPEIGVVRMSRLAFTGETNADLISQDQMHYWRVNKAQTRDPYLCSIGVHLYHRRFWDAYGDIPSCPANIPGQAELNGIKRFQNREGPTVAIPMRYGEDWGQHHFEPWDHFGCYRTDDYASTAGSRL